jgi:serine/threonine protein kinase
MDQYSSSLSVDCRSLIKRMLDKVPDKRITIREIMRHPWIAKYKDTKMRIEWGYPEDESSMHEADDGAKEAE